MFIFYKELSLEDGFEASKLPKNSRIVGGREVSTAGGIRLFELLRGNQIRCWKCKCIADRWISEQHENCPSRPVLNLYATNKKGQLVLMTRDHIIPQSEGGIDDPANLRPGCEPCNGKRGTYMTQRDLNFMRKHPELISQERLQKARAKAKLVQDKRVEHVLDVVHYSNLKE